MRLAGPGASPDARVRISTATRLWMTSGGGGGYVVVLRAAPPAATLRAVAVAPERTNPHPGPSLAAELVAARRFHERSLTVWIEPFVHHSGR